ncbi:MAG: helix-turn-helix domain-containing protein, partial [Myxococcota bacterium]
LLACDGPTATSGLLFGEGGPGLLTLADAGTLVLQNGARLNAGLGKRLRDTLSASGHDVRLIVTHSGPQPSSEHPLLAWVAPARLMVPPPEGPPVEVGATEAFKDAKERWVQAFERRYLERCLQEADGNLSRAARAAGLDRKHLRRLLHKHGLHDRSASGISQEVAYPEGSPPRRTE